MTGVCTAGRRGTQPSGGVGRERPQAPPLSTTTPAPTTNPTYKNSGTRIALPPLSPAKRTMLVASSGAAFHDHTLACHAVLLQYHAMSRVCRIRAKDQRNRRWVGQHLVGNQRRRLHNVNNRAHRDRACLRQVEYLRKITGNVLQAIKI